MPLNFFTPHEFEDFPHNDWYMIPDEPIKKGIPEDGGEGEEFIPNNGYGALID